MIRLHAAPAWHDVDAWLPIVAAHVAASPAGEAALRLTVGPGDDPDLVAAQLTAACVALAEGEPFADLELDLEGAHPGDRTVASAAELLAAVGAAPPAAPSGPEALVEHARWAKRVRDEVQAVADRARFEAAPLPPQPGRRPLVTVRIATWGDVTPLLTVALPSVLHGPWEQVEVLVCSDGPQPHARAAVEDVAARDPRVRYLELPERPRYPDHPYAFWRSAGAHAVNRALDEARGAWVLPLDHDDAWTQDHVATLLGAAERTGSDFVWGQALSQHRLGWWQTIGAPHLCHGGVAHGTVAYSSRLAHFRLDPDAWLLGEPGDWNMWRRIQATGAGLAHVPAPVLAHFREHTSIEADPRTETRHLVGGEAAELRPDEVAAELGRFAHLRALAGLPRRRLTAAAVS